MEFYNETGKTKTGELRVTRPIGAILIAMTQDFSALSNETITAFIERANGNNTEICTDLPLKALMAVSVAGNPAIFSKLNGTVLTTTALCELCEEGSINLQETESIKIKLDGLKSGVTYALNGVEYPRLSDSVVLITRKNLLDGETDKFYNVQNQELMIIENVENIIEMNVAFENGMNCKYTPEELTAISRDFDAVKQVKQETSGTTVLCDLPGYITYPLVAVNGVDIKKKSGVPVTLFLKDDVAKF